MTRTTAFFIVIIGFCIATIPMGGLGGLAQFFICFPLAVACCIGIWHEQRASDRSRFALVLDVAKSLSRTLITIPGAVLLVSYLMGTYSSKDAGSDAVSLARTQYYFAVIVAGMFEVFFWSRYETVVAFRQMPQGTGRQ